MTKKWKDTTKGGHKILSIHGPDKVGDYVGVFAGTDGEYVASVWNSYGSANKNHMQYDLVPAEPEIEYRFYNTDTSASWSRHFSEDKDPGDNLKLGFCKDTGKLLSAEVLK